MLKKHLLFNVGFTILFFIQLITQSHLLTELLLIENLHYFTKPLITISLIILLVYHTGLRGRFSKRIASGLFFGLLGDICLMFDEQNSTFFTYGLVFFLLGHLSYISAFYLDYKMNTTVYKNKTKSAAIVMGIFSIAFYAALWSYLGDLKIPVAIYTLIISTMVVMAVNRFGRVNSLSFRIIFIGAMLFVISDSALAVDRFIYSFPLSGMLIMATYMAAQYLITMGNLERKMKKKVVEEGV
jgi:uncharacterized membrane protein YhhN